MSPSLFSSRSDSRDTFPLLPQHRNSLSLADLSPRPSMTNSRTASPSPPPSFYRDDHAPQLRSPQSTRNSTFSLSLSPSRTKVRRIQFAAPPPPIAASILLPTSSTSQEQRQVELRGSSPSVRQGGGSSSNDPLLGLWRREKYIQDDLQLLLDAQSAGLVQGFEGDEGTSDAGSSTPTTRSGQGRVSGPTIPVRQPKKKAVGLRAARRGLLRCMRELEGLKTEEDVYMTSEIERRADLVKRIEQWEGRIYGLRSQLDLKDGEHDGVGEESMEIADLQTEERALDSEIRDLEDRLAQMKARKRWLGERVKEGVNRREARLSSYRGALRNIESEVKEFLQQPPIPVSVIMGDEEGLFALPAGRRTLEMARDWWHRERNEIQMRKQKIEPERAALDEGAQLWEKSINDVTNFEDDLRRQMASNEVQDNVMLRAQVGKMRTVIVELENTLSIAEEKGWNLLICAVGAELEAFREGEGILNMALETALGDQKDHDTTIFGEGNEDVNGGGQLITREGSVEKEESEDDKPNLAELLIDRGDHDGSI